MPIEYSVFLELLNDDNIDEAKVKAFSLRHGIDAYDQDGRTLLMNAVTKSATHLIDLLLAEDPGVNAQDNQGLTALHFAAIEGNAESAELLVGHGASIDIQDQWGNSPLWRAAMNHEPTSSIVSQLLSAGADVSLANEHGVTPRELLED